MHIYTDTQTHTQDTHTDTPTQGSSESNSPGSTEGETFPKIHLKPPGSTVRGDVSLVHPHLSPGTLLRLDTIQLSTANKTQEYTDPPSNGAGTKRRDQAATPGYGQALKEGPVTQGPPSMIGSSSQLHSTQSVSQPTSYPPTKQLNPRHCLHPLISQRH